MRVPGSPQGYSDLSLQCDQADQQLREGEGPEEQARHQARCCSEEAAAGA